MPSESNEIISRLATLEAKVETLENKTDKLESNNPILFKMSVLLEQQTETTRELKNQIGGFHEVVRSIDSNLSSISNNQDLLNAKLDGLDGRVDNLSSKVNQIEDINNEQDKEIAVKGKFDMLEFLSKDVPKLIFTAIVVSLLTYYGLK